MTSVLLCMHTTSVHFVFVENSFIVLVLWAIFSLRVFVMPLTLCIGLLFYIIISVSFTVSKFL